MSDVKLKLLYRELPDDNDWPEELDGMEFVYDESAGRLLLPASVADLVAALLNEGGKVYDTRNQNDWLAIGITRMRHSRYLVVPLEDE